MSIIIFFGMALFIFLMGVLVVGVTIYRWRTEGIPASKWSKSPQNKQAAVLKPKTLEP